MKKRIILKLIPFFSLLLMLLLLSCEIVEPKPARWKVTLNIPLFSQTYYIGDLASSDNIIINHNGVMQFFSADNIDDAFVVKEDLKTSANPEGNLIPVYASSSKIPKIDFMDDEDDVNVIRAEFFEASLKFKYIKLSKYIESFTYTFEEIRKQDGNKLSFPVIVKDDLGSDSTFVFDLAKHTIENISLTEPYLTGITFSFTVSPANWIDKEKQDLESQGFNPSQIEEILESIEFKIYYDEPLYFSNMFGKVNNLTVEIDPNITEIDTSDYPDNIQDVLDFNRDSTRLTFNLLNSMGFDGFYSADIYAENDIGETREFAIRKMRIERAKSAEQPKYNFVECVKDALNENKTVADLMNILPTKITVKNSTFEIVNKPEYGSVNGFISIGKAFEGVFRSEVDFNFSLISEKDGEKKLIRPSDTQSFNISADNREKIETEFKLKDGDADELGATFIVLISNRFNSGADIELYLFSTANEYEEDDLEYMIYKKEKDIDGDEFCRLFFPVSDDEKLSVNANSNIELRLEVSKKEMKTFYAYENIYFGMELNFHDQKSAVFYSYQSIHVFLNLNYEKYYDGKDIKF